MPTSVPPPRRPVRRSPPICPYLVAADGGWRSIGARREHRCSAVNPPTILAEEKQRRLCLVDDHRGCSTYLAAAGPADDQANGGGLSTRVRARATTRPLTRTMPVLLDQRRIGLTIPVNLTGRGRGSGWSRRVDGGRIRGPGGRTADIRRHRPAARRRRESDGQSGRDDERRDRRAEPRSRDGPTGQRPGPDPGAVRRRADARPFRRGVAATDGRPAGQCGAVDLHDRPRRHPERDRARCTGRRGRSWPNSTASTTPGAFGSAR